MALLLKSVILYGNIVPMIMIDNILVSDEVVSQKFVCDLNACKGICCIEGESGAPLDDHELDIMDEVYPKVKPYMTEEGINAVEEQGTYTDDDGMKVTLIGGGGNGGACAFVNYDDKGWTYCTIERAYEEGVVDWQKPVSCHLYPVRVKQSADVSFVNYFEWEICDPACKLGESLKVPVYQFTKDALIRKFGEEFYETLEATVAYMKENPDAGEEIELDQ